MPAPRAAPAQAPSAAPAPLVVESPKPPIAATPPPATEPRAAPAENLSNITVFGEVEMTDGVPLELKLNSGRTCILTPKVRPDGSLQMSMVITEETTAGATRTLSAPSIIANPGTEVSLSVGEYGLTLTPKLKNP